MLGYNKKDILDMEGALEIAITDYLDNGNNDIAIQLSNILDLLQGLVVEGHI